MVCCESLQGAAVNKAAFHWCLRGSLKDTVCPWNDDVQVKKTILLTNNFEGLMVRSLFFKCLSIFRFHLQHTTHTLMQLHLMIWPRLFKDQITLSIGKGCFPLKGSRLGFVIQDHTGHCAWKEWSFRRALREFQKWGYFKTCVCTWVIELFQNGSTNYTGF